MASKFKTIDETAAIQAVKSMLDSGSGDEAALQYLRDRGYLQIDSISVMRSVKGLSLMEAKKLIDRSHTWEDQRGAIAADLRAFEGMQGEDAE